MRVSTKPRNQPPYYLSLIGSSQIETPNIDVEKTVRIKVLVDISQSINQSVDKSSGRVWKWNMPTGMWIKDGGKT